MAKNTLQYKTVVSIHKDSFIKVVVDNPNLRRKDYRVLLQLMTHLDSVTYKKISKKNIADVLNMSKADVNAAIENLEFEEVIKRGDSDSVSGGYVLCF